MITPVPEMASAENLIERALSDSAIEARVKHLMDGYDYSPSDDSRRSLYYIMAFRMVCAEARYQKGKQA